MQGQSPPPPLGLGLLPFSPFLFSQDHLPPELAQHHWQSLTFILLSWENCIFRALVWGPGVGDGGTFP